VTAQEFVNVEAITGGLLFSRDGYLFGYLAIRAGDNKLMSEEERTVRAAHLAAALGVEREPWQLLSVPRAVDTAGMLERLVEKRKETRSDARLKLLNGEIAALQDMAREGTKEPLIVLKCWVKAHRGADLPLRKRLSDLSARLTENLVRAEVMGDREITWLCKAFADLTEYQSAEEAVLSEEPPMLPERRRLLRAEPGGSAALVNLITPVGGLAFGLARTTVGSVTGRIYGAVRYPAELPYGWAVELMNGSDCVTSVTYTPGSAAELGDALSRSIRRNGRDADSESDARRRKRYMKQAQDADRLIESLDFNNAPIGHVSWLVMPFTGDEGRLEEACRAVVNRYGKKRIKLKSLGGVQKEAYRQLSPYYANQPEIDGMLRHIMPLETLMGGSPMVVNVYRDPNGAYFAKTADGTMMSVDFLFRGQDRTNGNLFIAGQPGGGKTTALKSVALTLYMLGVKILVIDPEREFRALCENLGGLWLDVGGGVQKLNLFHIRGVPRDEAGEARPLYDAQDNALAAHMRTLEMIFRLYLPDVTSVQQSLLMRAVEELYAARAITWETNVTGMAADAFPIAQELYAILEAHTESDRRYEDLAALVYGMAKGQDSFLFNGYTSAELDNDFVVLDTNRLQNSSDRLKKTQYLNALALCWDSMAQDRTRPVFLLCADCHVLIDPAMPEPAMYLRNISKRARKYECAVGVDTQAVSDLLDERIRLEGQALIDNAAYKLLFAMDGKSLEDTAALFRLTEAERSRLLGSVRGEALCLLGRRHVLVNFDIPQYKLDLMGKGGGR
jgi:hypothetical protein